jgi:hypothetical protein
VQSVEPLRLRPAQQEELFGEVAESFERPTGDGHVAAPHVLHLAGVRAIVELALAQRLVTTGPRRTTLEQEPHWSAQARRLGEALRAGDDRRKPRRGRLFVVVDEADQLAAGVDDPDVASGVQSSMGLVPVPHRGICTLCGSRCHDVGCGVSRPVVGHEHLVAVAGVVLHEQAAQTHLEMVRAVPCRDHDRHERAGHDIEGDVAMRSIT